MRRIIEASLALLVAAACTESVVQPAPRPEPNAGASAGEGNGGSRTDTASGGAIDVGGQREPHEGGSAGLAGEAPSAPEPPLPEPEEPDIVEPEPEEPEEPEPEQPGLGLPCDVQAVLRARCQTCHGRPPVSGALVPLLSYADLTAPSLLEPAITVAASSVKRMKDSALPMPPAPAPHVSSEELAAFEAWLAQGTPRVDCDPTNPSTDPYDAPATCSSGKYWGGFDSGNPWMLPGHACITCHRKTNRAPRFTLAGTVFSTAHEPDKCHGVDASVGATIVITDANGQELPPIRVTAGGNFGVILPDLALPYRAKIVAGGKERVMLTPQVNGDCNACHSQQGAQGARGRIILP